MALNIQSGKIKRPVRMCIYGAEGIGKTTLAAHAPDPLFIDLEKGSLNLDVNRITDVDTWEKLTAVLTEIRKDPTICKTLIIDTADRADALASEYLCTKYNVSGIESFGYGKGYTYLAETFTKFLKTLDTLVDTCGINIIITAHGKLRKQELPEESGAFDRWEMKLSKQVAPLVKEWCDTLLFCNYKTMVVETENKTKKAQGGTRVMYTSHNPCWDAKNRADLPPVLPLLFEKIAHLFDLTPKAAERTDRLPRTATDSGGQAEPQLSKRQQAMLSMLTDGKTFTHLQRAMAELGKLPEDASIESYTDELIDGFVAPKWADILILIDKYIKEEQK